MPGSRSGGSEIDVALGLWRRRKRLASMVFCMMLAGITTFTLSLPTMYRSTAKLLLEHRGAPEGLGRTGVASDLETQLHTITEEALSRARLKALMDRFNLYPEVQSPDKREAAVERLWGDIQVKPKGVEGGQGRPTTIAFSVSFRGRDPETGARVANALASFYVSENLKLRQLGRLARLRQELAQLQQRYSDQYPDVIRLKAEIAAGERQLSNGALETGERRLAQETNASVWHVDAAPQREPASQEASRGDEFRILDPAIPAWKTAAPNRLRLVFVGVLLAIGATAAAVLLAERLDSSFHTLAELRAFTTVPVVAEIPHIVTATDAHPWRSWRTAASMALSLGLVVLASYYLAHGNEQLVWILSRGAS